MWLAYYALIVFGLEINSLRGEKNNWLNIFGEEIVENVKPYQLVLFSDNFKQAKRDHENSIINKLSKTIPSITVDSKQLTFKSTSTFLGSPVQFVNHRQAATYVLFHYGIGVNNVAQIKQFKNFVDFFVPGSEKYPRPRCLVLFINDKWMSDNFFKSSLEYAWSKKFLDFTIMALNVPDKLNRDSHPYVYYFNPFFDSMIKERFGSNVRIFPAKLRNVKGYPLRFPVINIPPFVTATKDNEGHILNVDTFFLLST